MSIVKQNQVGKVIHFPFSQVTISPGQSKYVKLLKNLFRENTIFFKALTVIRRFTFKAPCQFNVCILSFLQTFSVRRGKLIFMDGRSHQQDLMPFCSLQKCSAAQHPDLPSTGLLLYPLDHDRAESKACTHVPILNHTCSRT